MLIEPRGGYPLGYCMLGTLYTRFVMVPAFLLPLSFNALPRLVFVHLASLKGQKL